jgi:NitT/TauT family transport system substrate-binding protein
MITRRRFIQVTGAAGAAVVLANRFVDAQTAKLRLGNAAGVTDAQLTFVTVGQHPKLNYYKEEGIDVEVLNMQGSAQTLQALATNNVEFTNLAPPIYAQAFAKNPGLNVINAYVWMRQVHWSVTVKPESPIKELRELKGKKIGIRNTGDTGFFGAKAMIKEIGLDPERDFEWVSVGSGAPAAQALDRGQVDALAIWDAEYARIENLGVVKLRHLPNTPGMRDLFGGGWGVNRTGIKANRDKLVRLFRGIAKSTVFAAANPELAIRMHWQIYPETKPKGKGDAEALREALNVIKTRTWKWLPADFHEDKRIGGSTLKEWQALVRFVQAEDKIKDASILFTNDLLDDANKFARKAIEEQAKRMAM